MIELLIFLLSILLVSVAIQGITLASINYKLGKIERHLAQAAGMAAVIQANLPQALIEAQVLTAALSEVSRSIDQAGEIHVITSKN